VDTKLQQLRTAVYIDGYNLCFGRLRGTPYKWLDVVALFQHIVHTVEPRSTVLATKFYTAPALALQGAQCQFGHYLEKSRECRRCHSTWTDYEEKMPQLPALTQDSGART
jgi:hypothetical protein